MAIGQYTCSIFTSLTIYTTTRMNLYSFSVVFYSTQKAIPTIYHNRRKVLKNIELNWKFLYMHICIFICRYLVLYIKNTLYTGVCVVYQEFNLSIFVKYFYMQIHFSNAETTPVCVDSF